MKFIFLDTETTGMGSGHEIIQLSFLEVDFESAEAAMYNDYAKPTVEIDPGAMAVHHITPEKLINCPPLKSTKAWERLQELNTEESVMVIHNAPFDLGMLQGAGFEFKGDVIDTLEVSRKHIVSSKHSLQFLRYFLGLYAIEEGLIPESLGLDYSKLNPHDAEADVIYLFCLFRYLWEQAGIELSQMIAEKVDPYETVFHFGKHRGRTLKDVVKTDPGYIEWCLENLQTANPTFLQALKIVSKGSTN